MFTPGWSQMIIVLVIVLLLFGSRIPKMMGSLGKGVTEFKKGLHGADEDDEEKRVEKKRKSSDDEYDE